MIFIEEPKFIPLDEYRKCISDMTKYLTNVPGVRSIYQIGGLSSPGISDIDMVVIFDDGCSCNFDPRKSQSDIAKRLFTHQLFGTSASIFRESQSHTFFHNYKLLYGEELLDPSITQGGDRLKRQWAIEYMVRMLVNMSVEDSYNIYKVRNLLLNGKALLYDLDFLNEKAPALRKHLDDVINWRETWFTNRPKNTEIKRNIDGIFNYLIDFLDKHLKKEKFYLPSRSRYQLGRNIEILPSNCVQVSSTGLKLPYIPKKFAKKFISLQHRFNKFQIEIPVSSIKIPDSINKAFVYRDKAEAYNRQYLPGFMPLVSSLFLRKS